ncbi:MAG: LysE family transporter [Rhizobiaceae bacterium]|nr:LysE family transporter [Rhizobiaceae bacterium]
MISGLYLCWLGYQALRFKSSAQGGRSPSYFKNPLIHGLIFGLTNPKAYPVAVATLSALLSTTLHELPWTIFPLILLVTCLGGGVAYLVLIAIVGARLIMQSYQRHEVSIVRLSGLIFIGFGTHAVIHSGPSLFGIENSTRSAPGAI